MIMIWPNKILDINLGVIRPRGPKWLKMRKCAKITQKSKFYYFFKNSKIIPFWDPKVWVRSLLLQFLRICKNIKNSMSKNHPSIRQMLHILAVGCLIIAKKYKLCPLKTLLNFLLFMQSDFLTLGFFNFFGPFPKK